MFAAALLLTLTAATQDASREARELVEKLRSDVIEDRDNATRRLRELGAAALPELERAARDPDSEVAERARMLVRIIEIRGKLSLKLLKSSPGLEERLAGGNAHAWTDTFLRACQSSDLRKEDLEVLAGPALRGARANERQTLVQQFGQHQLAGTVPLLIPLLRDPDQQVSRLSVWSLCRIDSDSARAAIEALFKDKDAAVRRMVCQMAGTALGYLGARYEASIAALLADPDDQVRRGAIDALGHLKARGRVGDILKCLKDRAPSVRRAAAEVLGGFDCRDQVPAILPLLKDPDEGVREIVLHTLGLLQAREAAPRMAALLTDESEDVRAAAAWSLTFLNAREHAPALLPLLASKESDTRAVAAWALGRFGSTDSAPAIVKLLADESDEVRAAAAWSVGMLGAKEGVPLLLKLLDDAERDVRSSAAGALARLGATEAVPKLVKKMSEPKDPHRGAVAAAVERLGAREAIPALLKLLESDDEDIQEDAARTFRGLPAVDALPGLRTLAASKESNARRGAARALAVLKAPESKPDLLVLLKDPEEEVQGKAAEGLGAIGARECIPDLLTILKNEKSEARAGAAAALGMLRAKEAVPTLVQLADDGSREDEFAAIRALEAIGDTEVFKTLVPVLENMRAKAGIAGASWMCRAGRREGVKVILEEDELFTALNALRSPDLWKKLESTTIAGNPEGTWIELADLIAKSAGLRADWCPEYARVDTSWIVERRRLWSPAGTMTAAAALEQLMSLTDGDYDAILEGDVIRVIPESDASRFWKAWWEKEEKRK